MPETGWKVERRPRKREIRVFEGSSLRILESAKNHDGRSVKESDNKLGTKFFQKVRESEPEITR